MNSELLREFGLRPEGIVSDLEIANGLARAYQQHATDEHEHESDTLSVAATYFRRAAAHALLLGRYEDARELFFYASSVYQRLGLPYSIVVGVLSTMEPSSIVDLTYRWIGVYQSHEMAEKVIPQLAYVVLAQSAYVESRQMWSDGLLSIRRSLDAYRLRRLGILGISVGTYLDLIDSLVPEIGQRRMDFAETIAPILSAYDAAIRQASQSHYHWERLALPFHPADPDIYGVLNLTNMALRLHGDATLSRFIEQATISRQNKLLLRTVLDGITGHDDDRVFQA